MGEQLQDVLRVGLCLASLVAESWKLSWLVLLALPVGVLGAGVTAAEHYGPSADGTEKVMNAFSAVLPPKQHLRP